MKITSNGEQSTTYTHNPHTPPHSNSSSNSSNVSNILSNDFNTPSYASNIVAS